MLHYEEFSVAAQPYAWRYVDKFYEDLKKLEIGQERTMKWSGLQVVVKRVDTIECLEWRINEEIVNTSMVHDLICGFFKMPFKVEIIRGEGDEVTELFDEYCLYDVRIMHEESKDYEACEICINYIMKDEYNAWIRWTLFKPTQNGDFIPFRLEFKKEGKHVNVYKVTFVDYDIYKGEEKRKKIGLKKCAEFMETFEK